MKLLLLFLVLIQAHLAQSQIVAAEYFIGQDPGLGNGTSINIQQGQNINMDFQVPIQALPIGPKVLHVRVKNSEQLWSLYARQIFFVLNIPDTNNVLTQAEYFIDVDPGVGNATPLSIASTYHLNNNFIIDLGNLEQGVHALCVRVRNSNGFWSNFSKRNFYINKQISKKEIIELEYFIDEDPGEGNATEISIDVAFEIDEIIPIELAASLTLGEHTLYMRTKNDANRWSELALDTFLIDESSNIIHLDNQTIKLYPNPTNGIVQIESSLSFPLDFQVLDLSGKLIHRESIQNNILDLSHLSKGVYFIVFRSGEKLKYSKLVKH
jgi:hypothetical protein